MPKICFTMPMTSGEIRKKFLEFFKARGHAVVVSSSLIPDDPSVLLTTAGMQQFKPYYSNPSAADADFGSRNTASAQKCFRTSDIDEVGDESHLTFFEMLGNFSFGGYFKKEAIRYAHEFLTKEMGIKISYVTIFEGKESIGVPKDEESRSIWQSLGVVDIREESMDDVFWGPTGLGGPCGPTTEIYCKNAAGQDIEVWNLVFNEFFFPGPRDDLLRGNAKLAELSQKGIDTGMGLERLAMISQNKKNIFETDLFAPLIQTIVIPRADKNTERAKRIIADHIRASAFLISDGVRPSNKGVGYILRRLMRRVLVYGAGDTSLLHRIGEQYGDFYPELRNNKENITNVAVEEYTKFSRAMKRGLDELEKSDRIDAKKAFQLYESYGLPYEVIKDFRQSIDVTREQFDKEFIKHQEISRAGAEKKFGGHGLILDTGELKAGTEEEVKIVTRLHTATHLLQAALRKVLGEEVHQMGSDITSERTRFDFSFPRKVTPAELKEVEGIVNDVLKKDYTVDRQVMSYEEAAKLGALHFFKEKYPKEVSVYTVRNKATGEVFSRELCGGPHVTHTDEIGEFKILKEESSSAGVRRIRATVG